MRIISIGRLLAMLLLLGGMLAAPVFDAHVTTVMADEDKNESGKNEGKDEKKDKKEKDNGKKDKDDKNDNGPAITPSDGYEVDVACEYDANADTTTCTFAAIAPKDAKKIVAFDLPEDAVCAEVVGGEHKFVDPNPNTDVTGYESKGNTNVITLVLNGEVSVEGTTTYWMKAADVVFPVTAPGIDCTDTATFTLETEPTATAPATTGVLDVFVYTCTDVPADTTDYDWFRLCDSEGGVHPLSLEKVSETAVEPLMMETDASGDAAFPDLEPGLYALEMTETTWCKAVSDNVDADGNVIIEAGQRTTVYGFVCEGKPAS